MSFAYGFGLPHWQPLSGAFSPFSLFVGGVQGAWYDPSDLTTLFQDSAGTTPVTAVEQPVGLMLDKSQGLVLGSELVSNTGGPFTSTTGWTANGAQTTVSLDAGRLRVDQTGTGTWGVVSTPLSGLTVGAWYKVVVSISFGVGGMYVAVRNQAGDGAGVALIGPYSTSGTYTIYFVATQTTHWLQFQVVNTSGNYMFANSATVKALPGNHAYQSINTSRPTLRARYNLLTYSEQFDNAYWVKTRSTVTANATTAPDGTLTADKLVEDTNPTSHLITSGSATGSVFSVYAKAAERSWIALQQNTPGRFAYFDLTNGVVGTSTNATGSIESVGNGWFRCTITVTSGASTWDIFIATGNGTASYTGNGTSGVFLWGAQLTQAAVFPSNTYQRIGAATDYATGAAFPPYLFFDGTDDSMLTNSVDFATVTSDGQARRNLLLNPTQFDDAYWIKGSPPPAVTVTANSTTDPFGGPNADTITEIATTVIHNIASGLISFVSGTSYAMSAYAKNAPSGRGFFQLAGFGIGAAGANIRANFDLVNGTVTAQSGGTGSIQDVGNGWYRCIFVFTCGTSTPERANFVNITSGTAPAFESYLGDITKGLYLYGAQLETGSTATAFQNIGTDRMLVVAGVTKSSDAAQGAVAELSATIASNNGAFLLTAPNSAAANYNFSSKGTTQVDNTVTIYAAPRVNVLAGVADIAAPSNVIRVNGVQAGSVTTTQGTGNFGNYPLFIGRRNNATLPLNGNIYSLIIAGQSYSSGQISSTESWVAAKTPLGTI